MIQMGDISQICLGLGVVLFLTGCVMFFVLDVYKAWTILTGRQRKANKKNEEKNIPTEEIVKIKEQMEQAKISLDKTEKVRKSEVEVPTEVLQKDEGEEATEVLQRDEGEETTVVLEPLDEEITLVLNKKEENVQDFQIEQEILFIHAQID